MTDNETPIEAEGLPVVCVEPVPTLFIDGYFGATCDGDVIKMNLYEVRYTAETDGTNLTTEKSTRHVVARLAMSVKSFTLMLEGLKGLPSGFGIDGVKH